MAVNLSPVFGVAGQLFDDNGNPLAGGKIFTYLAGTTTNASTYTSASGSIAHSNPIVLDGAGRVPSGEIWLTDGISYKFVVQDAANNLIGTYDNLAGINSNFIAYTAQQEIQTATAGQTVFNLTTIQYLPATNNLSVFVDGVNQYGPGAQYAYIETDSDTVTFINGLHVGALVKFTTASPVASNATDAENVSYTAPFVGSITTNVEQKLSEVISVKDFGAVGDGVADDATAIQDAFDAALGRAVFFPSGTYLCSQQITSSGQPVSFYGASVSSTKVAFTQANGGFAFVLNSQNGNTPPDQLSIQNITIESRDDVTSPAIDAEWTTYQPNAQGSAWIENVNITRSINATGSFTDGILLNKCVVGTISNVIILGDDARVSSIGVNLVDCISIKLKQVDVNRYDTGASITKVVGAATEGFIFDGCTFYDVHKGIFVDGALHVNIINTHVNINGSSATTGIEIANSAQSYIGAGCLLYAGGLVTDPTGQVAVLLDACNGIIVENNRIVGVTKANVSEAILIDGSGFVSVNNNAIDFTLVGISIPTGTANSLIANSFSNVDTPYADSGTSTFRRLGFKTGPLPRLSIDPLWTSLNSGFASGDISVDSNFGGYIKGYSGSDADVTLATSGNKGIVNVKDSVNGFFPLLDNTYSVGTAALRYSVVYAATGTINTSDERYKQDVKDLSEAERQVAIAIKGLIKSFRFKDAVEKKGDKARIHFGVMAQQVAEAFEIVGLNPNDYALFCYDKWEVAPGVETEDRYGIRYDELLAFVISAS
jgi:hypothetical protein